MRLAENELQVPSAIENQSLKANTILSCTMTQFGLQTIRIV
jgi:hypothetical protein